MEKGDLKVKNEKHEREIIEKIHSNKDILRCIKLFIPNKPGFFEFKSG